MSIVATCYLERGERRKSSSLLSSGSQQSCWAEKGSIPTVLTMLATDIIMPGLVLNSLDVLTHLILTITLGNRCCFYTHSTDATTEASQKIRP